MSHLVESMAYVGDMPWHGLGNHLEAGQSLDVWAKQSGLDWEIKNAPVCFNTSVNPSNINIHSFEEKQVLYRSDTHAPLSVVGQRYKVVQPREILEFYRDLTEKSGFELETAGVLKEEERFGHLLVQVKNQYLQETMWQKVTYYWQLHVMAPWQLLHNLRVSVLCVITR
jgi:phage/plasmid-like protein (TIGR03299 family)